jgi:hypothetical protein
MTRSSPKTPAPPAAKKAARKQTKTAEPVRSVEAAPGPVVQPVPVVDRIPDVPLIYADAVLDVVFGIYTTKVIIGVETGGSAKATNVLTIPTEALAAASMKILENLASPGVHQQIVARHAAFAETLQGLSVGTDDPAPPHKH